MTQWSDIPTTLYTGKLDFICYVRRRISYRITYASVRIILSNGIAWKMRWTFPTIWSELMRTKEHAGSESSVCTVGQWNSCMWVGVMIYEKQGICNDYWHVRLRCIAIVATVKSVQAMAMRNLLSIDFCIRKYTYLPIFYYTSTKVLHLKCNAFKMLL